MLTKIIIIIIIIIKFQKVSLDNFFTCNEHNIIIIMKILKRIKKFQKHLVKQLTNEQEIHQKNLKLFCISTN